MDFLLASVSRQTGLAREQLSIAFSHTHSAGLIDLGRVHLPGGELIPPYLERLTNDIAGIVRAARNTARPATLTYTTGRCSPRTHPTAARTSPLPHRPRMRRAGRRAASAPLTPGRPRR